MTYTMTYKQHREEEKRFGFCQERGFNMPMSEKRMLSLLEGISLDT